MVCIIWWLILIPLSANGHSSRIKNTFANLSQTPRFIFPGGLMLKSFAKYVAQEKKILRGGAHVGTLAAFVMDDLYMDHFIDNYT